MQAKFLQKISYLVKNLDNGISQHFLRVQVVCKSIFPFDGKKKTALRKAWNESYILCVVFDVFTKTPATNCNAFFVTAEREENMSWRLPAMPVDLL